MGIENNETGGWKGSECICEGGCKKANLEVFDTMRDENFVLNEKTRKFVFTDTHYTGDGNRYLYCSECGEPLDNYPIRKLKYH